MFPGDGHDERNLGTLTVHAEETVASRIVVEIKFHCSALENKDMFSTSDVFLRVSRSIESGGFVPICKTEVVNNNLNPIWKPVCLTMQQVVSKENPLLIECFDFNGSGNHQLIGKVQKLVEELKLLYQCNAGVNFISPSSGFRRHEKAVMTVGEVIQFYDSDRRFPAWGFGGKLPNGSVSHYFNLNGSFSDFEVEGVEGIMAAYESALQNISLSGPALFGQVINKAASIAGHSLSLHEAKYNILLIITDGVVNDLQEIIESVVKASDLPLSILIMGVGGADFKQMEILHADNGHRLESSSGRIATCDIVQFIPMREVHSGQISAVQAMLEELPSQLLSYVCGRDVKPRNVGEEESYQQQHWQVCFLLDHLPLGRPFWLKQLFQNLMLHFSTFMFLPDIKVGGRR